MDAVKWLLLMSGREEDSPEVFGRGDPIFLKQFNEESRWTIAKNRQLEGARFLGRVRGRSMKRKFSRTHTMHYFTDM